LRRLKRNARKKKEIVIFFNYSSPCDDEVVGCTGVAEVGVVTPWGPVKPILE
jgi:hypothetical protein